MTLIAFLDILEIIIVCLTGIVFSIIIEKYFQYLYRKEMEK